MSGPLCFQTVVSSKFSDGFQQQKITSYSCWELINQNDEQIGILFFITSLSFYETDSSELDFEKRATTEMVCPAGVKFRVYGRVRWKCSTSGPEL